MYLLNDGKETLQGDIKDAPSLISLSSWFWIITFKKKPLRDILFGEMFSVYQLVLLVRFFEAVRKCINYPYNTMYEHWTANESVDLSSDT